MGFHDLMQHLFPFILDCAVGQKAMGSGGTKGRLERYPHVERPPDVAGPHVEHFRYFNTHIWPLCNSFAGFLLKQYLSIVRFLRLYDSQNMVYTSVVVLRGIIVLSCKVRNYIIGRKSRLQFKLLRNTLVPSNYVANRFPMALLFP